MKKKEFSMPLNGKTLSAEFNDLVENANGSVILRYGGTTILATAVISKDEISKDYLPLTVDYEEKFYASGLILGSRYTRREGKPSDEAILSGRIVDRTIRPLFDQWIRNEIQVVITTLAIDEDDPDVLAVVAASLAIGVSKIPFHGPVSAVRIGKHKTDSVFEINPTYVEIENERYEIDLVACGKDGNINMIELAGDEAQENVIAEAMKKASEEIEKINAWQKKIIKEIGVAKISIPAPVMPEEIKKLFAEEIEPKLEKYVMSGIPGGSKIGEIMDMWMKLAAEKYPDIKSSFAEHLFEEKVDAFIHEQVLKHDRRADGRKIDEIRPLFAQAGGISPVLHGSGIFYRGGTHILTALTLGGPKDALSIDGAEQSTEAKRFIHHYNFPPYSTGETGRMGGTNRRMIGHGALAEKALEPMIPDNSIFPYTIRLVSEALSSNGSTSMGSVCASTVALMDGGVPMKAPVAGIASGLMMDDKGNFKILTDIQGPEDHYGDMDFKVAGTKNGVTAIQMDVKVAGVPIPALIEAFAKAKIARLKILDVILKEIAEPRKDISTNAPKILILKINPDQIGGVIGSGGKTIKEIKAKTGADIDIEDDGTVYCTGKDGSAEKAKKIIEAMTHVYVAGEKFIGTVTKTTDFGAFVRIGDTDNEGLVHVSEIASFRVDNVAAILKPGDKVPIMVKGVDERDRISLSIKLADPEWAKSKMPKPAAPIVPPKPPTPGKI